MIHCYGQRQSTLPEKMGHWLNMITNPCPLLNNCHFLAGGGGGADTFGFARFKIMLFFSLYNYCLHILTLVALFVLIGAHLEWVCWATRYDWRGV